MIAIALAGNVKRRMWAWNKGGRCKRYQQKLQEEFENDDYNM